MRKFARKFIREISIAIGGAFIFVGLINYSFFGLGLYYTIGYWVAGIITIGIGASQ